MSVTITFGYIYQDKEQSEEKMVRRFEQEEVLKPAKKAKVGPKQKAKMNPEDAEAAAAAEEVLPLSAPQAEKAKKFLEAANPKLAEVVMLTEALEVPTMREYVASYKLTAAKKTTDKLKELVTMHEMATKEGARRTTWKLIAASASECMKQVTSTLKDLKQTSKEAQKVSAAGA